MPTIHGTYKKDSESSDAVPIKAVPDGSGEYALLVEGTFTPTQLSLNNPINHTTSGAAAEDAWIPSGGMVEGRKISIIISGGDAYIGFDEDATAAKFLMKDGEAYSESDIELTSKVSIMRVSTDVQIRGMVWGV